MTTIHYVDGQAIGTDPTSWNHFAAVRDWFAALAPGARVAWTDDTLTCGPWVLRYADAVVPAIEVVAPFNWLWTLAIESDPGESREWCLLI